MSLSCSCAEADINEVAWIWYGPSDYKILATKRVRRCCSCGDRIRAGSTVAEFTRYRAPRHEIEESIWGDEVQLASYFMCERCADLYFSITDLGYCVDLLDDMREIVREYAENHRRQSA